MRTSPEYGEWVVERQIGNQFKGSIERLVIKGHCFRLRGIKNGLFQGAGTTLV